MSAVDDLLVRNRRWAESRRDDDPGFFSRLEAQQRPRYLWIGCADSRVPANQIVGLDPGELFVHRNVANLVVHSDLNCLAVLQYAVDVLEVEHVIVCGHDRCGGVGAALSGARAGLVDNWLRHVGDVIATHRGRLQDAGSEALAWRRLVELNVVEQVTNVCRTTVVEDAWARGQRLTVHGWAYDIADGLLRDLGVSVAGGDELEPTRAGAIEALG